MVNNYEVTKQELVLRRDLDQIAAKGLPADSVVNYFESMGIPVRGYSAPKHPRRSSFSERVLGYYADHDAAVIAAPEPEEDLPELSLLARGELSGTDIEIGLFIDEVDLPVANLPGRYGPSTDAKGDTRRLPCVVVSGSIGPVHYVNRWPLRSALIEESAVLRVPRSYLASSAANSDLECKAGNR